MKPYKGKIDVLIEKTKTGYSAYAEDLAVFSTATTIKELHENLHEALNLYFADHEMRVSARNVNLRLDFQQFFKYYRVINAKFLAERIGMNPTLLSQYVSGNKIPSQKQSQRIINGIQEIGNELSGLTLS